MPRDKLESGNVRSFIRSCPSVWYGQFEAIFNLWRNCITVAHKRCNWVRKDMSISLTSIQWDVMWSPMQSVRQAGLLELLSRCLRAMFSCGCSNIQMEAGGWRMLRVAGGLEWRVMQLLLLDTPLAADKPLWTSQAAYNKQDVWCHQSLSGFGANWSAACSERPWVDIYKGGKLWKSSTGQVLWLV